MQKAGQCGNEITFSLNGIQTDFATVKPNRDSKESILITLVKVTWSLLYYTKKDNIFSSITYSLGALQKVWVLQKCIQIERRAWYLACRTLQSTLFSERVDIHDFQHQLTRK